MWDLSTGKQSAVLEVGVVRGYTPMRPHRIQTYRGGGLPVREGEVIPLLFVSSAGGRGQVNGCGRICGGGVAEGRDILRGGSRVGVGACNCECVCVEGGSMLMHTWDGWGGGMPPLHRVAPLWPVEVGSRTPLLAPRRDTPTMSAALPSAQTGGSLPLAVMTIRLRCGTCPLASSIRCWRSV